MNLVFSKRVTKMIESVSDVVLKNCTIEVINQFPELMTLNESYIWLQNRSCVLNLLNDVYSQHSELYTDTKLRILFK